VLSRRSGSRYDRATTVNVTRPGPWGNPFHVKEYGQREAVRLHRRWILERPEELVREAGMEPPTVEEIRQALRGMHLACWCRPGLVCHADTLMEIANSPDVQV
jgi:hypothetical protein